MSDKNEKLNGVEKNANQNTVTKTFLDLLSPGNKGESNEASIKYYKYDRGYGFDKNIFGGAEDGSNKGLLKLQSPEAWPDPPAEDQNNKN
jgi:hypothetical protein